MRKTLKNSIVMFALFSLFLLPTTIRGAEGAAAGNDAALNQMRDLAQKKQWKELADQYNKEDFKSWPDIKAGDAFFVRAQANAALKDAASAEKDLKMAVKLSPGNGMYWLTLGEFCRDNLKDDQQALSAFQKAPVVPGIYWHYSAVLSAAEILCKQKKYDEALKELAKADTGKAPGIWRINLLRAWGETHAANGQPVEAVAKLNEALGAEGITTDQKAEIEKRIGEISASLGTAAAASGHLVLAANGKSEYQIILPDSFPNSNIGAWLNHTAQLIRDAFLTNGFDVPVVAEGKRDNAKPGIYLGGTEFARANGVDTKKFTGWGYVHKVIGRDVIIAGADRPSSVRQDPAQRSMLWDRVGTVKGAADFLRQYMGVRFLYPDLPGWATLPTNKVVSLLDSPCVEFLKTPVMSVPDKLDASKTPVLEYNIGYPQRAGFYDIANNLFPLIDIAFGCHTYPRAVPAAKYREKHPEYFALVNGQRTSGEQYCISNPEVQELFYQDIVGLLDRGYAIADLGQPDGFTECQCDNCRKLFDTESWSEKLWVLHRNISERVLKSHPEGKVMLMAYCNTETAPESFKKFPKNVIIMLCGTNEEDIEKWKSIEVPGGFTSYLYNWCPNQQSGYTPTRTPRFVEAQAKRLFNQHVVGINRDGPGALFGSEGPVYYTMYRMFDDPASNRAVDLVSEYCTAAFGRASPAMFTYFDTLYNCIELYSEYLGTRCPGWRYADYTGRSRQYVGDPFHMTAVLYTPGRIAALEKSLSQAEKLADTPKISQRLALVRREFDYIKGLANVVYLYNAFQLCPDRAIRERLLDAIDARNAMIDAYYSDKEQARLFACWPFSYFPPVGHDANHLKLKYNLYQGAFKDSCLNWDTKAMREAPLPGAARMKVNRAGEAPGMDSEEWKKAEAQSLKALPGAQKPPARKTSLRAMFDKDNLYVRVEGELPPGMANFAAVERDGDFSKQESLDIIIAPFGSRDKFYRFKVGPLGDSKYDASNGFITDPMDPRVREDDPTWNGEWKYESRLEKEKGMWIALLVIPFKTLKVNAPEAGMVWLGNAARSHFEGTNVVERSIWAANPDTKGVESREAFGDIVFDSGSSSGGQAAKNPVREIREKIYAQSGEVPPEWKKLTDPVPAPLTGWLFRADMMDQGEKEKWYSASIDESIWKPMSVPSFWAENEEVGDFQGFGWYRVKFTVPAEWKGKAPRLLFGSVDEQTWIYVNGELVREHTEKSEKKPLGTLWEEPFAVDLPPDKVKFGESNLLAVRVRNDAANGGIWRPVLIHAADKK
jgi:tetratricopeptide (TPR) repeat protein